LGQIQLIIRSLCTSGMFGRNKTKKSFSVPISVNDNISSFKSKKSNFNFRMKILIINFNVNLGTLLVIVARTSYRAAYSAYLYHRRVQPNTMPGLPGPAVKGILCDITGQIFFVPCV
jgi:hypothetical protein